MSLGDSVPALNLCFNLFAECAVWKVPRIERIPAYHFGPVVIESHISCVSMAPNIVNISGVGKTCSPFVFAIANTSPYFYGN